MNKLNQSGVSGVVISLVLSVLMLVGAIGFGAWAFTGRQDYKNNVDTKIDQAVAEAKQAESARKDKLFAEESKNPLKTYASPDAFGSLKVQFPKTWSGYVDDSGKGTQPLDGYFAPGVVPSTDDKASVFALRVQVVDQPYADVLKNFEGQQKAGKLAISAYALPKLPDVVGAQVTGEIRDKLTVTMVVLPLRGQTLQFWTEGSQYVGDFTNIILPDFSYTP